jgi:hypothetical protein
MQFKILNSLNIESAKFIQVQYMHTVQGTQGSRQRGFELVSSKIRKTNIPFFTLDLRVKQRVYKTGKILPFQQSNVKHFNSCYRCSPAGINRGKKIV